MDEKRHERIESQLRFLNIFCTAMVISVAVYAAIAWFVVGMEGFAPLAGGLPPIVIQGLAALAIGVLAVAPLLFRRTMSSGRGPTAEDGRAEFESYRMAVIVAFALREVAAIIGFMLTLLTGDLLWCLGLAAVTIVAMFLGWPRREQIWGVGGTHPV